MAREKKMEIAPLEWLTWLAAGGAGLLALAVLARGLDAMLDLERG